MIFLCHTNTLTQMLLILQMINDRGGHVHKVDFARRLYDWMRFGFRELGDVGMYDPTHYKLLFTVSHAVTHLCNIQVVWGLE